MWSPRHVPVALWPVEKSLRSNREDIRVFVSWASIRNHLCLWGLCMVKSIEEIIYLNDLCDRLGMDTITAGNLAAFAIEAAKRKKIKENLQYGDVDGIAEILTKIAFRKGAGRILSEGVRHAAEVWGMEEKAIHVKGLEPAGFDPRVLKGMGLLMPPRIEGLATSGRPSISPSSLVRLTRIK